MDMNASFQKIFKFLIFFFISPLLFAQEVSLHAHNDYEKTRPLYAALEQEIYSIEIDIFLTKNGITVSHIPTALASKPKLKNLYLLPLKDLLDKQQIRHQLTLVFDIKNGGNETCKAVMKELSEHLSKHKSILRILFTGGFQKEFRSQYRDWNILFDHNLRRYIETGEIPDYTGRFSESYSSFKQTYKLYNADTISKRLAMADMMGIESRLWAAGNSPLRWDALIKKGFTILNVDRYAKARKYLNKKLKP